jgi:hypothetical protein
LKYQRPSRVSGTLTWTVSVTVFPAASVPASTAPAEPKQRRKAAQLARNSPRGAREFPQISQPDAHQSTIYAGIRVAASSCRELTDETPP